MNLWTWLSIAAGHMVMVGCHGFSRNAPRWEVPTVAETVRMFQGLTWTWFSAPCSIRSKPTHKCSKKRQVINVDPLLCQKIRMVNQNLWESLVDVGSWLGMIPNDQYFPSNSKMSGCYWASGWDHGVKFASCVTCNEFSSRWTTMPINWSFASVFRYR